MPFKYESELMGATLYPKEKKLFFYGGIFSQWAGVNFICTGLNETVNCAEQAMMLHKAKLFGDQETYEAIKAANHPSDQKRLGRKVRNYNDVIWEQERFDIVTNINIDKFEQSRTWKELLLITDPYEIIEASPVDKIWGIGMGVDNPDLLDESLWGRNLLGKAIREARNSLLHLYGDEV